MVFMRMSQTRLDLLLGLRIMTTSISNLALMGEQLDSFSDKKETAALLVQAGRSFRESNLHEIATRLCCRLRYCKERARAGFGDPRVLLNRVSAAIAEDSGLLAPIGQDITAILLASVIVARMDLETACGCVKK